MVAAANKQLASSDAELALVRTWHAGTGTNGVQFVVLQAMAGTAPQKTSYQQPPTSEETLKSLKTLCGDSIQHCHPGRALAVAC